MQLNLNRTIKDLFENANHDEPANHWTRDWSTVSSLHVSLPEARQERLCSLFLRLSSVFEAGIYFQQDSKGQWQQLLCFNRGVVKNPTANSLEGPVGRGIFSQVQKTEHHKWTKMFARFFPTDLEKVTVYRIQLCTDTFILVADRLPDPWMKKLMADTHERILLGIP
ncbi:MAG: hypothetical protein V4736_03190 [Bdellovibrionota bacterium]